MLDHFAIFTRGGALLWALQFTTLRHSPVEAINALVRGCLLEERSAENTFTYIPKTGAHQALKWTFHNGLGLVFVAVYQKTLSLLYVDELLESVKREFTAVFKPGTHQYKGFDATFQRVLRDAEARAEQAKRPVAMRTGPPAKAVAANGTAPKGSAAGQAKRGGVQISEDGEGDESNATPAADTSDGVGGNSDDADNSAAEDGAASGGKAFDVSKLPKGKAPSRRGRPGMPALSSADKDSKKKEAAPAPKGKKMRNWNTIGGKATDAPTKLDFTTDQPEYDDIDNGYDSYAGGGGNGNGTGMSVSGASESERESSVRGAGGGVSRMDVEEDEDYEDDELTEEDLQEAAAAAASNGKADADAAGPKKRGLLASFISSIAMNVVGKQSLTAADLEPALADMKRRLMERNVAEEIASNICSSVGSTLEGQRLAGFTGVGAFVRRAFEDALSGILNKRSVDVLLDIKRAQARGKPYVIVFCGVNGVGKSTNLAKIAYWLGGHGIKVTIAACDTFRAGAVEQLKTHCARLKVPLYERGYEKDPAKVAYEAVRQAEREGRHVVLVDTAGRMQDNEPLMRSLSSLIALNSPDLVLFVGEALVGNDAVDQLVKFNRSLTDLAPNNNGVGTGKRQIIDGIVLTKFDTIDDKVGAAVSMVYASGAPVMFLGCGQTYADLKRLNVKSVVRALLK